MSLFIRFLSHCLIMLLRAIFGLILAVAALITVSLLSPFAGLRLAGDIISKRLTFHSATSYRLTKLAK